MSGLARLLAARMLAAASGLLPPPLSPWARAMERELLEIEDDRSALLFAAGCLRAAVSLALAARLEAASGALRCAFFPTSPPSRRVPTMNGISARPRLLGLICGAAAVGAGLAYMAAADAPSRYLLVNFAALVLGATAWLALGRAARSPGAGGGIAILALSVALLATALFGVTAEGATRWVSVGPLSLQVSLIVVPAMMILYARRPDWTGTAGMIAAALALALQPDRAMAGVLAAVLIALLVAMRGRRPVAAAASASVLAFGWTLFAPDRLASSAFVDGILYSAFDVHPLAGAAVAAGAVALIVPAVAGLRRGGDDRAALLAFGLCWSAAVAAAALGNYPTPLVGYGGSAILGYLLSVALLPGGGRETKGRAPAGSARAGRDPDRTTLELRAAPPVPG